jgi:hypothetical protein
MTKEYFSVVQMHLSSACFATYYPLPAAGDRFRNLYSWHLKPHTLPTHSHFHPSHLSSILLYHRTHVKGRPPPSASIADHTEHQEGVQWHQGHVRGHRADGEVEHASVRIEDQFSVRLLLFSSSMWHSATLKIFALFH